MIIVSLPWGQAPETCVLPDFNIAILSSMIKLTFPLVTYIGWDYNFHFNSTEYQLNLSILRTARSRLFTAAFKLSPVFIGVVIMRLRVFIMRVHIKTCIRVLKCSMKIYNQKTFQKISMNEIHIILKQEIQKFWGSKRPTNFGDYFNFLPYIWFWMS